MAGPFYPLARAIIRSSIVVFLALLVLLYGMYIGFTNIEVQKAITERVEEIRKEAPYHDPYALSMGIFSNNAYILGQAIVHSLLVIPIITIGVHWIGIAFGWAFAVQQPEVISASMLVFGLLEFISFLFAITAGLLTPIGLLRALIKSPIGFGGSAADAGILIGYGLVTLFVSAMIEGYYVHSKLYAPIFSGITALFGFLITIAYLFMLARELGGVE